MAEQVQADTTEDLVEQAPAESVEQRNERELTETRAKASVLERALKLETTGVDSLDQAANKTSQQWLDDTKLALLPLFYLYLPLLAIFVIVVIELMLPLWRSSWTLPLWRKVVYWVYIVLFVFLTITILGALAYLYKHPDKFCTLVLDGTWWGAVPGVKQAGCSVFGWLFNLFKPG